MTSRALILSYMRNKRLACSVAELRAATRKAYATVHDALSRMENDGIVRSRKNADGTVIWFLAEMQS